MKILNKSRKTVLCERTETAESFFQQSKGLMFRKKLKNKSGLLMVFNKESRTGIWMFGMRFPVDIVFINSRKGVVDVKRNANPLSFNPKTWRVYYPKKPAMYVLEMNTKEAKVKIGDLLGF